MRVSNTSPRNRLEPAQFQDLQAVDRIPADAATRERLLIETHKQVFLCLKDRLEKDDVAQLVSAIRSASRPPTMLREILDMLPSDLARRINAAFDALILEQAAVIGPRILWSLDAQQRVLEWGAERDGARKYKNFGSALAGRATPGKKAALSEQLRPFRADVVKEVRLLQGVLKGRYPGSRPPSTVDLIETAAQIIADNRSRYDRLRPNLTAFRRFLENSPQALTGLVFGEHQSPTRFTEEFMAFCTNRSAEALRQAIAIMPNSDQRG
jgi:hypothetical protein